MGLIRILVLFIRGILRNRAELAAENLALRQQLAVLQQKSKRPRLRKRDRIFWTWLALCLLFIPYALPHKHLRFLTPPATWLCSASRSQDLRRV